MFAIPFFTMIFEVQRQLYNLKNRIRSGIIMDSFSNSLYFPFVKLAKTVARYLRLPSKYTRKDIGKHNSLAILHP